MADHRAPRPRYGRLTLVAVSAAVTAVAVLGGAGALPTGGTDHPAVASPPQEPATPSPTDPADTVVAPTPSGLQSETADPSPDQQATQTPSTQEAQGAQEAREVTLPAASGSGRRVVFSESRQRVWLVDSSGRVVRTYPVSGSRYDNLTPGTYEVYSRSEQAWGVDGSTMNYFVRFAHGPSAAIGFHDIPELGGEPVQTTEQLGTPLSHGCVRQRHADARLMWDFAPIGTPVVVTA